MDLERATKISFGVGLMLNSFGVNRYLNTLEMEKCSKVNLHLGLSAFFLAGALKTYRSIAH